MNNNLKTYLIAIACILVGGGAFTYGAMTAPGKQSAKQTVQEVKKEPIKTTTPTKPEKLDLNKQLEKEIETITNVLTLAYPNITTNYTINKGQLFDKGQWFGTTLTYKGSDTDNRDTLRMLMQKKNGEWKLRTAPPQLLLSTKEFPDVPKKILQSINKPISLPAGAANSPTISVAG